MKRILRNRWIIVAISLGLYSCSVLNSYEVPLSKSFNNVSFDYRLRIYRDSLKIIVSSNSDDVVLDYEIRNVMGRYNSYHSQIAFLSPLVDTLTMTWKNGEGETRSVFFQINSSIFENLPAEADTVATAFHPGDIDDGYVVSAQWYTCQAPFVCSDLCRDESGFISRMAVMKDTLSSGEQRRFTSPAKNCRLGSIIFNNSQAIPHGVLHRHYIATYNVKQGPVCGANECVMLK
jgi:hypothetical protein